MVRYTTRGMKRSCLVKKACQCEQIIKSTLILVLRRSEVTPGTGRGMASCQCEQLLNQP